MMVTAGKLVTPGALLPKNKIVQEFKYIGVLLRQAMGYIPLPSFAAFIPPIKYKSLKSYYFLLFPFIGTGFAHMSGHSLFVINTLF